MDSCVLEDSDKTHDNENQHEISVGSSQSTTEYDENSEVKDEGSENNQKSTFKNALQAKKRLQAFALQKQVLISPSTKSKSINNEKTSDEPSESQEFLFLGSKPKKENPLDKAKATIEEIELLKKLEFSAKTNTNDENKTRRSRSKSSERNFVFRKRDWKVRNYRRSDTARRSPSPMITTARDKHSDKSKQKYPKNWEEFVKDNWTFEKLISKDSRSKSKSCSTPNDMFRQLLFTSPADLIKPYHFKNERGDDISVPFKFLRYTLAKPKIAFNENILKVKEPFLNRKQVLNRTGKDNKAILEKFYSRSTKKFKTNEPIGQRNWYVKNWRDNDSKVLETSIGLSFLQTYSDDDEEEEEVLVDINELNKTTKIDLEKRTSAGETKSETVLQDEKLSQVVETKIECHPAKEYQMKRDEKEPANVTESDSTKEDVKIEENTSWTPERKVSPLENILGEFPQISEERTTPEEKNKIKNEKLQDSSSEKIKKTTLSDDEWAETPERKSQEPIKDRQKKKKSKQKYDSDGKVSKKKKKKLARKKKQREKEKKARKKEKVKAEKLKEKRKQKEKEKVKKKDILKKLKKELEQNLEEKRMKTPNVECLKIIPIKVKIEKQDNYEEVVEPVEDLMKFLDQKEKVTNDNVEMKQHPIIPKNDQTVELFNIKVKRENICDNKKKHRSPEKEEKTTEEIVKDDSKIADKAISNLELKHSEKVKAKGKNKKEDLGVEITPDTEEYQSNWESDDGISPIVKPGSKKLSRGWESDEEVFERAFSKKQPGDVPFRESPVLEMPLDIKKFPRRSFNRQEKKRSKTRSPEYLDMAKEIKLLEAERIHLNNERIQLEMEKIRIHELERKNSLEEIEDLSRKALSPVWHKNQRNREKRHAKDESIDSTSRDKREKEVEDKIKDKINEPASTAINASTSGSGSILSIHSSPEISSTKSPNCTGLESAYQEFMKAVSGTTEAEDIIICSTDSEMQPPVEKPNRSKVKHSRSRRDRKRGKGVEIVQEKGGPKVQSTTDPKILQEILLPGEIPIPEIPVPLPVPVPSPKLDLSQNTMPTSGKSSTQTTLLQAPAEKPTDALEPADNKRHSSENSTPKRPFSFSTLVIPTKRSLLLERSNWKVDDESDEESPPMKKMFEDMRPEKEVLEEPVEDHPKESNVDESKMVEKIENIEPNIEKHVEEKIVEKADEDKKREADGRRDHDRLIKRKHSRSRSPLDTPKDKKRREDDNRKREDEVRRREDDGRRREDDLRRREEDTRRKEDETRRRDHERREPDTRRRDNERKEDESRRRDNERKEDETRRRDYERKEDEIRRRDSERKEDETRRRDNERREEETRRRDNERRRDLGIRRGDEPRRRDDEEAKRRDRNKRPISPRHREPSPRRKRYSSPIQRRPSPRNRSPPRRTDSSRKAERRSPQRSSPAKRRRSYSPAKPTLPPRRRSPSPRDASHYNRMSKSPRCSPMEGLKRSVADSTISDDLLPQPFSIDSSSSPLCSSTPAPSGRRVRLTLSPKRPSLDERINQVLGIENQSQPPPVWKPTDTQADPRHNISYSGYHHHNMASDLGHSLSIPATSSKVLQVGNIIQVVPSEDLCVPTPPQPVQAPLMQKIVQVGNMLQIVPSDMEPIILPPPPPEPPREPLLTEKSVVVNMIPERQSAEDVLAGRMAEREKKRKQKEDRKKEKEKKRKEKNRKRKMRLKVSTEEMIKRALELDGYIGTENEDLSGLVPEVINETPGLDPSKSILLMRSSRFSESTVKTENERKSVQFADGVRPGEGTSPSGGEELSSPPPQSEVLGKPKKYKRLGSHKKKKKRKIKVKVIKKRPALPLPPTDSDEEYENLPPPSPPPGSPPPHVFPVRAKVHTINNIPQHYISSYGITTAPQTPPVVQPQPRMNLAFQTPPTAMYRTPPPHVNVVGQHFPRMSHAPPMSMNLPPPPSPMHRDPQPYGSF